MTGTYTQPTQLYTDLHCTCCNSLLQKKIINEYGEVVRRSEKSQEALRRAAALPGQSGQAGGSGRQGWWRPVQPKGTGLIYSQQKLNKP